MGKQKRARKIMQAVETTPHINQGKEAIDMRHRKNCLVKERD
jgi:hypothetical protein